MHKPLTKTLSASLVCACLSFHSAATLAKSNSSIDSPELRVKLTSRSPQQMIAFYEARGFSKPMLDTIRQYCFITAYIRNKNNDIIWLDMNNWQFISDHKPLIRIDRYQLKKIWQRMDIPLAHQSTFRWTLIPEQLDFRPNEGEGGNIVLPWTNKPISVTATFNTLNDKSGKPIKIQLDNIQCKKSPS